MRILVTGGAGYIGSVIVTRLTARGHDVTVFDDLSRGHAAAVASTVPLVPGDIRDADAVRAALTAGGCEAVVHMAALAEVAESVAEPERYRSVNVDGTAAVLEAAAAAGAGRLVFSSTAAVYGAPERTPIDEQDTLAPANPYGETKLAGEGLLEQARSSGELAATALRYFNACGADGACGEDHDPESHLIPLALRAARDGTPIRRCSATTTPPGRHLRPRLRARRRPRRRAHRRARGVAGCPGFLQPRHGTRRLGAGRAGRRRGGHRTHAGPRDRAAARGRPSGPDGEQRARGGAAGLASAAQPDGRRRRRVGVDVRAPGRVREALKDGPAPSRRQAVSRRPPARGPATRV